MKGSALLLLLAALWVPVARAGEGDGVRAAYLRFVEAQNARDLVRVRSFFLDRPEFLWVSDGRSVWGADAVLARMGRFQKAEVWRVEPDLESARTVELNPGTAMLHLPLTLDIGQASAPDRLRFLVSIVFVRQADAWKIAALLTTTARD